MLQDREMLHNLKHSLAQNMHQVSGVDWSSLFDFNVHVCETGSGSNLQLHEHTDELVLLEKEVRCLKCTLNCPGAKMLVREKVGVKDDRPQNRGKRAMEEGHFYWVDTSVQSSWS